MQRVCGFVSTRFFEDFPNAFHAPHHLNKDILFLFSNNSSVLTAINVAVITYISVENKNNNYY